MKKIIIALLFTATVFNLQAQAGKISQENLEILGEYEDTLGLVSYMVIHDSLPENRFAATKKLITTLVQALKTENSFNYKFGQVRSVSIQYPADSTFRIFTWQLYVDVDDYRYFGAIQMNQPELKLYPLFDRSANVQSPENVVLRPEKWYGALYYNIREFDTAAGRKYLLFGFNGLNLFTKRKVVDVLTIENGEARFGAPVFIKEDPQTGQQLALNRIVKEYSAESSFRMNYDETFGLIMFDHLVTSGGNYGQGPVQVTDGSYEGYKYENGRWYWVEKVFNQTQDEAPRPEPVFNKGKVDIFGKKKH
ncbi:MAG TPA: hypothetical protein ENJ95_07325 [Bacteroidetes bacterium]|nr:hypothetical protein [Bacteroidota bacterium]